MIEQSATLSQPHKPISNLQGQGPITALDTLEALRKELTGRGIVFALARVKQDLRTQLDTYGLTDSIGKQRMFPTRPVAVAAYQEWSRAWDDGGL